MPGFNPNLLVTTSTASGSDIVTGDLVPWSIRWRGATTAGHLCVVEDTAGKVLWSSVANGANYVEESSLSDKWGDGVTGLVVPTLDSGTVDIYYHL